MVRITSSGRTAGHYFRRDWNLQAEHVRQRSRAWLSAAVAFLLLNLSLSFHNVWPTLWISTRWELSVEAAVIGLALGLVIGLRGRASWLATKLFAGVLIMLVVGRYVDVTAHALYGRSINLYWDAQHLPGVVAMLAMTASHWQIAAAITASAGIVMALVLAMHWLINLAGDSIRIAPVRAAWLGANGAVIALFCIGSSEVGAPLRHWFAAPVTRVATEQIALLGTILNPRSTQDFARDPLVPSTLEHVADADVVVIFVESYGATTFDRHVFADRLATSRERLSRIVRDTDHRMVSAMVRSPTFGGGSWLAHASLLSGVEVRDDRTYRLLLASGRESLVHRFRSRGYRTVGLMPGIRMAWPEGGYYGYEKIYDADALDYRGPAFGWWRIPDQFSLARANALELRQGERRPVFMLFTTISSHAPFTPVPPYASDWQALSSATSFGEQFVLTGSDGTHWADTDTAYRQSIDYALQTVGGFLEQPRDRDLVLVVIGDHQPAAAVSGADASHDVPVHVITRRGAIVESLRDAGFVDGANPARKDLGAMHRLTNTLLEAFGGTQSRLPVIPLDRAEQAAVTVWPYAADP